VNNLAVQSIRILLNSEEKYCISALDNRKNGISGGLKNQCISRTKEISGSYFDTSIRQNLIGLRLTMTYPQLKKSENQLIKTGIGLTESYSHLKKSFKNRTALTLTSNWAANN
jgi:hypothetical protein